MNRQNYYQAASGFGDAFPGNAGPFVYPSTSPYQRSGSAASLAAFGADAELPRVSPVVQAKPVLPPQPSDMSRMEPPMVQPKPRSTWQEISYYLGVGTSVAAVYHGYKRNNGSIGWALGWGLVGGIWPIALPLMLAQGFAKPIGSKTDEK